MRLAVRPELGQNSRMRFGLFALIVSGWAAAQAPPELEQNIRQILVRTRTPAAAIAVVNRDGVLWTAAMGKADLAAGRDATPDTLFRMGSISKGFTALSIMMLVEEGRLSLEDPVRKVAPGIVFENRWETTDPVRVVHLLEHTTGWDDLSPADYAHNDPAPVALADALAFRPHTRTSRWKPGSGFAYCNSGPGVAAYIVQRIAGKPFETFVTERILQPLGMKSASYFLTPAAAAALARGYMGEFKPAPYWHISIRPAGALNASVREMAAYVSMHLNRGRFGGGTLLKPESMARIETPASSLSARRGIRIGYALGNYAYDYRGVTFHGHGGGMDGYMSDMAYLPEVGRGYICAINSGSGEAIGEIGALLKDELLKGLPKPSQAPVVQMAPSDLAQWAGYYEPTNPRVERMRFIERLLAMARVRADNGRLRTRAGSHSRERTLIPVGGDRFRAETAQLPERVFVKTEDGARLMVVAGQAFRRIPAVLVWATIGIGALCLMMLASTLLYAIWWIPRRFVKRKRLPDLALRVWPLAAALSLGGIAALLKFASWTNLSAIVALGTPTGYSVALFALSLVFPAAALASLIAALRRPPDYVSVKQRAYSLLCAVSACVIAAYLGYFGLLGAPTWR